ncbi:MAG TPA: DNA repair protein RecO [Steroidobacteraceae bacterium]|nr:DNA repair protein RecO [Steroidobacteraceae bacterium]
MQRVEHTPAFMLHQRPWGDSGRVVELFSREHGRLSVFARGVRGTQARLAAVLQPFVPLLVSWAGRGEAPRLTGAEFDRARQPAAPLPHGRLMSAWYLSELVLSLTARHDPQPELFAHYAAALAGLRQDAGHERTLRLFEKRLLDVLGYGVAELDEARFADPAELAKLRPVLRAGMARCLEGRPLRTRAVAVSLREFARARGGAGA